MDGVERITIWYLQEGDMIRSYKNTQTKAVANGKGGKGFPSDLL